MIAAHQEAALHLSLAQQCALVRTTTLKGPEAASRTNHHHIASGGERVRAFALQVCDSGQETGDNRLVRQDDLPLTSIVGCYRCWRNGMPEVRRHRPGDLSIDTGRFGILQN